MSIEQDPNLSPKLQLIVSSLGIFTAAGGTISTMGGGGNNPLK